MAMDYTMKWYGDKVFESATRVNTEAMERATFELERYVKTHFTSPGTGMAYKRRGVTHRASTANQTPAVDTGTLRNRVQSEIVKSRDKIMGYVGVLASVKYAIFLELGTRDMSPRPYLRPALRAMRKKIDRIFKRANS